MSLVEAMKEIRDLRTREASLPATIVVEYATEEGGKWWKVNTSDLRNRIHVMVNADHLVASTFQEWFNVSNVSAIKLANGDIYDFILNSWRHLYDNKVAEAKQSALDTQEGGFHYKDLVIQPVEYITKNKIPYPEGNVIKYVTRHQTKNGIEDIKKAVHYLQLIAELQYGTKL